MVDRAISLYKPGSLTYLALGSSTGVVSNMETTCGNSSAKVLVLRVFRIFVSATRGWAYSRKAVRFSNLPSVAIELIAIGCYRIDLYFPKYKIAVECDEHGHVDRDTAKEHKRQEFITEQLGCRWIRFDSHVQGFCILRIANRIMRLLLPDVSK